MREVFVVTTARTGSNLLVDYLNQLAGVRAYGELFKARVWDEEWTNTLIQDIPDAKALHERSLVAFWTALKRLHRGVNVLAAKLFYYHGDAPLWDYVYDRALVLHLIRRDTLATFVSLKLAEASGIWMVRRGNAVPTVQRAVTIPLEQYRKFRDQTRLSIEATRRRCAPDRYVEMRYEQLTDAEQAGGILTSALALPQATLTQRIVRQGNAALDQVLENYAEYEGLIGRNEHLVD